MEQLAAFPEESWRPVICRICKHPFAIAVEDVEGDSAILCQTCSILVDWFGQEEAAPSLPAPIPASASVPPKRAGKKPKRAPRQAQLGSLLERWGDLWRSGEEQE